MNRYPGLNDNVSSDEAEIQKRLREERIEKEVVRRKSFFVVYPETDFEDGDVVGFVKNSPYGGGKVGYKRLSYAAVYVNRQWWITGSNGGSGGMNHEYFLNWLFKDPEDTPQLKRLGKISE